MATIKSKSVNVNAPAGDVFDYLFDLNNLESLMPEGKIDKWQSDAETCSFVIKGLSGISMKRDVGTPSKQVAIVSHGKNPFDFTLNVDLDGDGDSCTAQLTFDGNMNFMIQTMASGPLTNLFNMMADKLVAKYA